MSGLAPVELLVDCTSCRLENGVVEIYDALVPACRFGLPARTRCKLCGAASEGVFDRAPVRPLAEISANRCPGCLGELSPSAVDARSCASCGAQAALVETEKPAVFATMTALEQALDAWARRDGFPSHQALAAATFTAPDIESLFAALGDKAILEVIADPFANMGVRTSKGDARHRDPPAAAPAPRPAAAMTAPLTAPQQAPRPAPPIESKETAPAPPPPSAPPRAIVYPLVSVIAADGEIHPDERALLDRFLQSEGLAPLGDHEFCVHHPSAVAHFVPKERREDVIKLMCETAAIDGMPDESERRVIRAYATAWGVDDEKLAFWMWGYENMNTSITRALWLKIRRFVLSARWSEADSTE